MPCDSISIFQASLDHLKNWDMLEQSAKEAGWYVYRSASTMTLQKGDVSIRLRKGGKAEVSGYSIRSEKDVAAVTSELTKAYTKSVVKAAAKKWGWQLQEKNEKLRLKRRS